jgi:hypothetical protein
MGLWDNAKMKILINDQKNTMKSEEEKQWERHMAHGNDPETAIAALLKIIDLLKDAKTLEEKEIIIKLHGFIFGNQNNSESADNADKNKKEKRDNLLFLIFLAYNYALETQKEERLLEFRKMLKVFKNRFNMDEKDIEQILANLKSNKPLFKDILNQKDYSDFIDNITSDFSKKQENNGNNKGTNGFKSNQTKINQTKNSVIMFILELKAFALKLAIFTLKMMSELIKKVLLNNKIFPKSNRKETVNLGQGTKSTGQKTDSLVQEANDVKEEKQNQSKNKEGTKKEGTETKEGIGTTKIPAESPSTIESLITNDNDILIDDKGNATDGQNHNNEEAKEENSGRFGVEEKRLDIMGRCKIEEVEKVEEDDGLKQDGKSEKPDEITSEAGDTLITPEDNARTNSETQDIKDNNTLNDNSAELPLEIDEYDDTAVESGGDKDKFAKGVEKDSNVTTDEEHTFLGSLEGATGTVETIEQGKKEESEKVSPSQSLTMQ